MNRTLFVKISETIMKMISTTLNNKIVLNFILNLITLNLQVGWVSVDTKAIQAIHEHVITHNPRVSVTHSDLNTWNLHIKSVNEEDRGGYMCQVNTDPMKSQVSIIIYIQNRNFEQSIICLCCIL